MTRYVKTFLLDYAEMRPPHFEFEKGDCSVRAMMILLGVSYAVAHAIMTLIGRHPQLAWSRKFINRLNRSGKSLVRARGVKAMRKRETVEKFIEKHPEGRFLLWSHAHCFAVIDGVAFDCAPVPCNRKLLFAWEFAPLQ